MSPWLSASALLAGGSALIVWWSRNCLRHPGRHGFYRFFAWEAILVLLVMNFAFPGESSSALCQQASSTLMLLSLALVGLGYGELRRVGAADAARADPTLYAFERTSRLVSSGIYAYIRHPMYASLYALAWGAYLQAPSWPGTALATFASFFLLRTAQADEAECLQYFGEPYAQYMTRTRRFVPYLF